jgi:hypothetical protein
MYATACNHQLDQIARQPELTLEEIRARLRSEKKQKAGVQFGPSRSTASCIV